MRRVVTTFFFVAVKKYSQKKIESQKRSEEKSNIINLEIDDKNLYDFKNLQIKILLKNKYNLKNFKIIDESEMADGNGKCYYVEKI